MEVAQEFIVELKSICGVRNFMFSGTCFPSQISQRDLELLSVTLDSFSIYTRECSLSTICCFPSFSVYSFSPKRSMVVKCISNIHKYSFSIRGSLQFELLEQQLSGQAA